MWFLMMGISGLYSKKSNKMKKYIIILICAFLLGCSKEDEPVSTEITGLWSLELELYYGWPDSWAGDNEALYVYGHSDYGPTDCLLNLKSNGLVACSGSVSQRVIFSKYHTFVLSDDGSELLMSYHDGRIDSYKVKCITPAEMVVCQNDLFFGNITGISVLMPGSSKTWFFKRITTE